MNTVLRVRIEERPPEGVAVRCEGDVDLGTVRRFDAAITQSLKRGAGALVLDLTEVTFFDSTAITALVECHRRCLAAGMTLEVVTNPAVERVLALVGFRSATHSRGGIASAARHG